MQSLWDIISISKHNNASNANTNALELPQSCAKPSYIELECAASNGNRYPPYPQVMATAISQ